MKSLTPLQRAVLARAREFAHLHDLLLRAGGDALDLYKPWGRRPKGSAFSAMTRDRLLEFVGDSVTMSGSEVQVTPHGEDWVRVWVPELGLEVPMRTRPRGAYLLQDDILQQLDGADLDGLADLFGDPPGKHVIFWRFNLHERTMPHWSFARAHSLDNWDCPMYEEVELPTAHTLRDVAQPESADDHDDLEGVVSPRVNGDQAVSEDELDNSREEGTGHESYPATGESS